jgi:hypothetical protein
MAQNGGCSEAKNQNVTFPNPGLAADQGSSLIYYYQAPSSAHQGKRDKYS